MKRMWMLLCLALVMSVSAALAESPYEGADAPLTLFAVNVGKGDALLLNCGADTYLIDTGLRENWGDLSRALAVLQVTRLKGVILTHTDSDHVGGALPLATSSIQVDGWYAPAYFAGKESKHPAVEAAAVRSETVTFLKAGDVLPLGTGRLLVAGPRSASDKENCNSLVLVAEAGGGRMLLTGDMEFPEEKELLSAGAIPRCSVLKVGNHGEDDATSEALLKAVKPQIAVISTSTAVEPDTPSTRVLTLLVAAKAMIYQTQDASSGVLVTIDGGETTANLMDYNELPAPASGVTIQAVDHQADAITLCNTGSSAVDLSGWYILSERGNEIFVLPEGTQLAPGGELIVTSKSSPAQGDLLWPEKKVWHKTKEDAAALYDVYGRLMDRYE
ncbi:MAG: lamin tail domain-containing protein [Clostridiales bacterium]|nr:lamin tail domain-containing protein [Clostridiales bacterium]